jgi:hypothetical protein
MEATLEFSELKQRFGKVVSSSEQCMKTPENSSEGVEDASCKRHHSSQCNAPHIQPIGRTVRRMGH